MEQDLNATLSSDDQQELNELADEIKKLKQESKQALRERSQVSAAVSHLNLLITVCLLCVWFCCVTFLL